MTAPLTPLQERILTLMANEGLTSREVGERLSMPRKTVDTHVERAIQKLAANNRAHALVKFDRQVREREAKKLEGPARDYVPCGWCRGMGFVREVKAA